MNVKEILLEIANGLPPDASLEDAAYEIEFRQAVEAGFASLDRGEGVPVGEVKKMIPKWIGKSSSPQKP